MKRPSFVASTMVFVVHLVVLGNHAASAQKADPILLSPFRGGPDISSVYVVTEAPIMGLPDASRVPLRIAKEGSELRLLGGEDGEWYNVDFADPQFGRRVGYIQAK